MKVDAAGAGLDEGRLQRIGQHLRRRYLEPGKIAGAQVAIVRAGTVGYFESFGLQDRERNVPVADDAIWRLYSMTKPITGVAMMTLYEQGHFQLDDAIDRWIPEWKNMTVREADPNGGARIVPAHRPPTIRDILTHTSGIGYGFENGDLVLGERNWLDGQDLASMAAMMGGWPLRFQPGQHWLYSHGMDIAARLVEIMSGLPYDEYLRTSIFEPLGMVDTDFWVPSDKVGRFAANYGRNSRKELVLMDDPTKSAYLRKPKLFNGGGGLVGTTADYLRFVTMLASGGAVDGRRVLGRKTIELMATNHLHGDADMSELALPMGYGEVGFEGNGFGLTVAVSKGPGPTGVVGTKGAFMWGGAASTTFWVDPVEELAVVFMTQLMPSGTFDFPGQLRSLVYGALQ
ncbi:MAG: beta-lactamase family protein [Acidimicrobiales bacterium]|nr:beta-lactamase family protein [Acidimicrobiales bacterium]MCB9393440.1 beta-lactamase family protein [Acidimicrobiaceae bacterium]